MEQNKQTSLTHKILVFLTALCLFFSAVEFALPKPFPFFRLGLANIPIILSLFLLSTSQIFLLVILKIFVQNLISGSLFSYTILFSIFGTFSSSIIMFTLYKFFYNKKLISFIGISLAGSLFNTLAQLGVSYFIMLGSNTKYIAPLLLILSFITGLSLGIFTEYFIKNSKWFLNLIADKK